MLYAWRPRELALVITSLRISTTKMFAWRRASKMVTISTTRVKTIDNSNCLSEISV